MRSRSWCARIQRFSASKSAPMRSGRRPPPTPSTIGQTDAAGQRGRQAVRRAVAPPDRGRDYGRRRFRTASLNRDSIAAAGRSREPRAALSPRAQPTEPPPGTVVGSRRRATKGISRSRRTEPSSGHFPAPRRSAAACGLCAGRQVSAHSHRALAEPVANLIHRLFEPPRPVEFAVEQGRRVGRTAVDERVGPDADQPKPGNAVGLAGEQGGGGAKQRLGQLGRVGQAAGARASRPPSTAMARAPQSRHSVVTLPPPAATAKRPPSLHSSRRERGEAGG